MRTYPARQGLGERDQLTAWLEFHRATLLAKCTGPTDDQLRERAVPPSGLSLLGLLRHLTEVEHGWFGKFAGEDVRFVYCTDDEPDWDFDGVPTADVAACLDGWQVSCARAREVTAAEPSLDSTGQDPTGPTLRWILFHVLEEYARHNGHADLLRERLDGSVGT